MAYKCIDCSNTYEDFFDLKHHMEAEHVGISSELLEKATAARQTKKQIGEYDKWKKEGIGCECPLCFEIFADLVKLEEHGKLIHQKQFNPEFLNKLQKMKNLTPQTPPICEKCNRSFSGLVTTRMENKVQNICFDCYENHFGVNALRRLTIGTPDDVLDQMRKPII